MTDLTGKQIANTYKQLLKVAVSTNDGIDSTVRTIESGDGTNSALQLSNAVVNVNGTFEIGGVALTASVSAINEFVSITGTLTSVGAATTYGTGTGVATDPSAGITKEGVIQLQTNQSFGTVSVSTNLAGVVGGFSTSLSATNFVAGTGSFTTKVSGVAAEFSGAVSAANLYATTQIYIGGSAIPSTSDVAAVSVLTSVNKAAITSVNTVLAATSAALATSIGTTNTLIATTSAALATSIGNSNTNITTNTNAITSINSVIGDGSGFATDAELATVSAALATSIGNSNTNITTNINAITSINTVLAATSAALATSIGNSNTLIAATSSALATSIGTTNTRVAATSTALATSIGTTNTLIATTSAALATSIGNHLPLAGGTLTGIVSGTDFYVSAVAIGTNALLGKNLRIETAAVADINALTDGTNISINFNAGQNFTVTLAGNRTLDNPTNCVAGQVGSIFIVQDGTGSQTLAYGSSWDFAGGEAPTLSTDANAIDRLDYIVHTSTDVQALLTKAYS
tara:strand:- start:3135 stop:4685 length:1551 start_codon:yes stop_codon:yes gene_type:complete